MSKHPIHAWPAEDEAKDRAHWEAVEDALYQLDYIRRFTEEADASAAACGSRPIHLIVCKDMAEVVEAKRFLGLRLFQLPRRRYRRYLCCWHINTRIKPASVRKLERKKHRQEISLAAGCAQACPRKVRPLGL